MPPTIEEFPTAPERMDRRQQKRAATPLEALIQTKPHEDPEHSALEHAAIYDTLNEMVDQLPERYSTVLELIYWQRLPLRKAGKELQTLWHLQRPVSKTQVARLRDIGLNMLRQQLPLG